MILGLIILYWGLQLIDYSFGLHWKEYSVGVVFLSAVITILCFISEMNFAGLMWGIVTLIEYRNYLLYIKN